MVRRLVLTYLSAAILALLSSRSLAEFNEADFGTSLVRRFSSGNRGTAKVVVPGEQVAQGSLGGESGTSGNSGNSGGGPQTSSQPSPSNPSTQGTSNSSAPAPVASNSGNPSHEDHRSSSVTPPVSKPAATANLKNATASVNLNKNYPTVASNDPKSNPSSSGNTKSSQAPKNSPPAHKPPPSRKPPHK